MFKRFDDEVSIAQQIANLLNTNNKLGTTYSTEVILAYSNEYIIETLGGMVLACARVEKQSYALSEIKHLVVHPSSRNRGLAKYLLDKCIHLSKTPILYATIREDNIFSQKVFVSNGFSRTCTYTTEDRDIYLYTITCPKWKKVVDKVRKNNYTT